jgi:type IV pilus assembly protein PilW
MSKQGIRHVAERGLTLIELMVAMVLGLLVAGGIVTLFISTSGSNRVQTQLARLQEDGRFAIGRLNDDLGMASGMYCNNTGGVATQQASTKLFLDGLLTPKILAKTFLSAPGLYENTTSWGATSGTNTYPAAPTAAYSMPSFMFMRGYNCTGTAACKPIAVGFLGGTLNTVGTNVGNRVKGTDVLTVRYLDSSRGWRLGSNNVAVSNNDATGTLKEIDLSPNANELPVTAFKGSLALLADCSNAQVFAVTGAGTGTLTPDATNNFSTPLALQPLSAPRLFDFQNDVQNVTYYVQVVSDDGTNTGNKTGALMRRVNGTTVSVPDQELIRGVERLTFRYGVEDSTGGVRFLTADQVDSRLGKTISCPPTATSLGTSDAGCLWRAVKSIEVSVLLASPATTPVLSTPETAFLYTPDQAGTTFAPVYPTETDTAKLAIKPTDQGFTAQRLRRQFTSLVMLRNYNP